MHWSDPLSWSDGAVGWLLAARVAESGSFKGASLSKLLSIDSQSVSVLQRYQQGIGSSSSTMKSTASSPIDAGSVSMVVRLG